MPHLDAEIVEIVLAMNGRAWELQALGNTAAASALWEFTPQLIDLVEKED